MKTDRELLELAAKADGIPVKWDEECACFMRQDTVGTVPWNPLTDDGDALRLAVKLNLLVPEVVDDWKWCIDKKEHLDVCANYRRTVVRAAAAIGEAK